MRSFDKITRRAALAAIALALAACAAPENSSGPAPDRARISILLLEEVDPSLGPATVSVDNEIVGAIDRGCGLIVDAPAGERLLTLDWGRRAAEARIMAEAGRTSYFEVGAALAIFTAPAPENASSGTCSH